MKLTFDKTLLTAALAPAMSAVSTKNTITAIEGILLTTNGKESCTLTAYDLEKGLRTEVPCVVEEEGSAIINAQKLNQIVRVMGGNSIEITVDDKLITTIRCGKSKFELHALAGSEFPLLPQLSGDRVFTMSQKLMRTMITKTAFAVAQNDQRPAFKGVYFQIEGEKLTVVSCDGNRLAVCDKLCQADSLTCETGETSLTFLVPGKALLDLSRLMDDEEGVLRIQLARKYVIFEVGNFVFFSRLIESEFINYQRILPEQQEITAIVDCDRFIDCLGRASLVTEDKIAGSTRSYVKCAFEGDLLKISSVSVTGTVYDEIPIGHEGGDLTIGFNCRLLLDALRSCQCERIRITMSTPLMGILITEETDEKDPDDTFRFFIMPIRMKD